MVKKIILSLVFVFGLFFISCDQMTEDEGRILSIKDSLKIPNEISEDIELITSYEIDGFVASIKWESSNTDVLSNEGKVLLKEGSEKVELKATITLNQTTQSIIFYLKVNSKTLSFSIDYQLNGGNCSDLITQFDDCKNVILPTPTKEGYIFIGWFEGETKVETIQNRNYNLEAKWKISSEPTLVITSDTEKLFVDYEAELSIEGYDNLEDFEITASKPDFVVIDPEGYVAAKKAGTIVITCTLKENPSIFGTITIQIFPKTPSLVLETKHVIVGKNFILSDMNYDSFDDFILEYDEKMIEYSTSFKALKSGTTTIKVAFKEFPEIFDEIEITIYDVEPQLSILNNQIIVGETSRIDVANYEVDELKFEAMNPEIVSFEGKLVTGIKTGEVTVKVSLLSDLNIFSTIDLVIVPIKPVLKLASENILVGGKTRLIIDNLSELEYTNLDDYKVEILLSSLIATIDNEWLVEGKSLGEATFKVTAKNNHLITETIKVNVVKTSENKDSNGEIADGPLVLTIDNFNGYIHAGEMTYVKIDGAKDLTKYKWITSDDTILNVYEDGRIICIKEGSAYVIAYNQENKEVSGRLYINIYGIPNVNYIDRLIEIAESQLGYKEGADNDTKYGDWYGLPNEPWCAMFVSWCAYQAGIGTDVILKYAGCAAGRKWFEDNGRFGYKESYTPKAGDIIFFLSNGASHTGIVINCVGSKVYTIEGNTSNMCAKRSYDLNHNTITGYGIPNYPEFNGEVSGGDIGGSTEGGNSSTT